MSGATQSLLIQELVLDRAVQVRDKLDRETVQRYAEAERLPPIRVVRTKDGDLFVADGFHRVEAIKVRGEEKINALVVAGEKKLAYEIACRENSRHGKSLTSAELDAAMLHLRKSGYSIKQVAEIFGVSESVVEHRATVSVRTMRTDMGSNRRRTLSGVPDEFRKPIEKAAKKHGWDSRKIQSAAALVENKDVPRRVRTAVLEGKSDPFIVDGSGEVRVLQKTFAAGMRGYLKGSPRIKLAKVQYAMGDLMLHSVDEIVEDIAHDEFAMILSWIAQEAEFMQRIAQEMRRPPKIVSAP